MFPLNLQKNIVQLDRQISLLENECKNMEVEKKKKSFEPEPSFNPCSKISSTMLKPTVKVTSKKSCSSKKSKKSVPPASVGWQCTNSLPSCTKPLNELGDISVGRKTKLCGANSSIPLRPRQVSGCSCCNPRKDQISEKCVCSNEASVSDFNNDGNFDVAEKDHLWHKELLIPHYGGAIEVTVTQKPNRENDNLLGNSKSIKKPFNLESKVEKDLGGCKCYNKGPKWSDILCVDSSKKKANSGNYIKNKIVADETKTTNQALNYKNKKFEENNLCDYHNNYSVIKEESFQTPVKLHSQSIITNKQADNSKNKFEKETQCSLEKCGELLKDSKYHLKLFQYLVNQFQKMAMEEINKKSLDVESTHNMKEESNYLSEESKKNFSGSGDDHSNVGYKKAMSHFCENFAKEKILLYQELEAKENSITALKKREEEYVSLIANLKANLERAKGNSKEGVDALKEIQIVKNKLIQQVKVSKALKKNHMVLQNVLDQCNLENDKLKTQIKILQLEAQKHEFLLAGKQAEINRYKEEIQNFQQQISDHLAALKTNSEGIDIEKMIEAIVQQSQIFAQTDVDSVLENDVKDSSKTQNILIHSSPNSTKTVETNHSSWKQISSIHDHDHDESKANSDIAIYLNDNSNEKDFFQLFEKNSFSEFASPKKLKESSVEKSMDKNDVKHSSSFTSCISIHDESNTSDQKNSDHDSLISNEPLISFDEKSTEQLKKTSQVSVTKAQNHIDELLKNMKLKFSKEVFETSLPSCTTEDFLCVSQISSSSQC